MSNTIRRAVLLAALAAPHLMATSELSGQESRWTIGKTMDDFTNRVDYHYMSTTSDRGGLLMVMCKPPGGVYDTQLFIDFGAEFSAPTGRSIQYRYKVDGQLVTSYGDILDTWGLKRVAGVGFYDTLFEHRKDILVNRDELEIEVDRRANLSETFHVAGYQQSFNLLQASCRGS
ncbi:MAG: hypothetical protein OXN18_01025 [Gemmatimonadota bacterium]|nr:hypothetical protein [Gemmatimonadota bacterium]